jgi:inositol-pentakisphosphate 2-kinase
MPELDTTSANMTNIKTADAKAGDTNATENSREFVVRYNRDILAVRSLFETLCDEDLDPAERMTKLQSLRGKVEHFVASAGCFTYVAEGRANAVFKIDPVVPEHSLDYSDYRQNQGSLIGALIRVPIVVPGANQTPYDYERLQQYRQKVVEPAVGVKFLVPQFLIKLETSQTDLLDTERKDNSTRMQPTSYIGKGGHAMIMQDMRPRRSEIGFEFKPKWLAQSPIAPEDATRCRTCAREASRNYEKLKLGKKFSVPVCPLGLVHYEPDIVLDTIRKLAPDWPPQCQKLLRDALEKTKIMRRLRVLQMEGDPGNDMFENPGSEAFGLAMTLRDCTVFVRMFNSSDDASHSYTDPSVIDIKLADVDEKNWQVKNEYWQKTHTDLVDGFFYQGCESPRMETDCYLDEFVR